MLAAVKQRPRQPPATENFLAGQRRPDVRRGLPLVCELRLIAELHRRDRALVEPSLQAIDLFEQRPLLLLHFAKELSHDGILCLQG